MAQYTVAVRALSEFTAKEGDLDVRFTPSPTAQEGIAGHAVVAARRGREYQRELSLQADLDNLCVRGRADGYDAATNRLEEFKTHRGDLERMPGNHRRLHWCQVKIYGAMLCRRDQLQKIDLALVYFDVTTGEETILAETFTAIDLQAHFELRCRQFLAWAVVEVAHRARRNQFLTALKFPYPAMRVNQRHLAESVYRTAAGNGSLMAQAPTGIGKTMGTLFPLLKAAAKQNLDKVLMLVAKTSGRSVGLNALRAIAAEGAVRILEFVSKTGACEYPGRACSGESCPLAKGFYDRLPAAREAAAARNVLDHATLRATALEHRVCPYYLGAEMARWCDVIVGDYNYYFDSSASLYALTVANDWRIAVMVDEAHNLLPRARDMYSASLKPLSFESARRCAPSSLKGCFAALLRAWVQTYAAQADMYEAYVAIPAPLIKGLQTLLAALSDHFAADAGHMDADLQQFYFEGLFFNRMAEAFGPHSLFDITIDDTSAAANAAASASPVPQALLSIRNVVPGVFLSKRFTASAANILFSATLGPPHFYRQLLGLPEDTAWIDVDTSFDPGQLAVRVARGISTRYRDRVGSAPLIVELIARQYRERPGNYLAFFSSFEYLNQVSSSFEASYPLIPSRRQSRLMDAGQRSDFLDRFTTHSRDVVFAVLGGAFAEGVDLPGDRLIGAFIATLGMPQVNLINAQLEARMQSQFGAGYEYTYLYPGLQKVVQAAGRVIRTLDDRGTVHLMDDRFTRPEIRALLPTWWRVQ